MIRRANPRDQPLLECETVHAGGPGSDVELVPSMRLSNHERPQPAHHYDLAKPIWTDDDVHFSIVNGKKSPVYRRRARTGETEILGYIDMRRDGAHWTPGPSISRSGSVTRSVDYPNPALNAVLNSWYDHHGTPTGATVYRSQGQAVKAFTHAESSNSGTGDALTPDDIKPDWEEKMEIRDAKTVAPETIHDQQTGLKDFRDVTQADINPDSIPQADPRLAALPAFLDDDEFEEISKYTPGTGSPRECDHCNEEDWHSHPLESGVDALRPGGIAYGDPEFHKQHICDKPRSCKICGCPTCNASSIDYRQSSEDYRCNACDLEFPHPVPRQSDGERARLYWQCAECGMATQAAFTGIPEDLLDAAPQAVFDTDD